MYFLIYLIINKSHLYFLCKYLNHILWFNQIKIYWNNVRGSSGQPGDQPNKSQQQINHFLYSTTDQLVHLLPTNTDNSIFTEWICIWQQHIVGLPTNPPGCSAHLHFYWTLCTLFSWLTRSPALPVVALLIYPLCHFCAICHRKRRRHQRWILHETLYRWV